MVSLLLKIFNYLLINIKIMVLLTQSIAWYIRLRKYIKILKHYWYYSIMMNKSHFYELNLFNFNISIYNHRQGFIYFIFLHIIDLYWLLLLVFLFISILMLFIFMIFVLVIFISLLIFILLIMILSFLIFLVLNIWLLVYELCDLP